MPIEYGSPSALCATDNLIPGHMTEIALDYLHTDFGLVGDLYDFFRTEG